MGMYSLVERGRIQMATAFFRLLEWSAAGKKWLDPVKLTAQQLETL